jgi:hypothetical protein
VRRRARPHEEALAVPDEVLLPLVSVRTVAQVVVGVDWISPTAVVPSAC